MPQRETISRELYNRLLRAREKHFLALSLALSCRLFVYDVVQISSDVVLMARNIFLLCLILFLFWFSHFSSRLRELVRPIFLRIEVTQLKVVHVVNKIQLNDAIMNKQNKQNCRKKSRARVAWTLTLLQLNNQPRENSLNVSQITKWDEYWLNFRSEFTILRILCSHTSHNKGIGSKQNLRYQFDRFSPAALTRQLHLQDQYPLLM